MKFLMELLNNKWFLMLLLIFCIAGFVVVNVVWD